MLTWLVETKCLLLEKCGQRRGDGAITVDKVTVLAGEAEEAP